MEQGLQEKAQKLAGREARVLERLQGADRQTAQEKVLVVDDRAGRTEVAFTEVVLMWLLL